MCIFLSVCLAFEGLEIEMNHFPIYNYYNPSLTFYCGKCFGLIWLFLVSFF